MREAEGFIPVLGDARVWYRIVGGGAEQEPDAEGGAQPAEPAGAPLRRAYARHVGVGGGEAGGGQAVEDAAHHQPSPPTTDEEPTSTL